MRFTVRATARRVIAVSIYMCVGSSASADALDRVGSLWTPFLEWSVENPGYGGNPFDLNATVTFTNSSGDDVTTEMFYAGDDTWKFRFTGTTVGDWAFVSDSSDPELDSLTGTATITPAPDPDSLHGFLTVAHSTSGRAKWAWEGTDGLQPFIPQLVMYDDVPSAWAGDSERISDDIALYFGQHGFNGFHLSSIGGYWFDFDGDHAVLSSYENPDPRTFDAVEELILAVHAAGGMVHIWPWGDEERGWTANQLPDGVNGDEDRRLQRYMAARWGALPGWSMGYGFDLDEWIGDVPIDSWRSYIQGRSQVSHPIGARPGGPNSGTDHSDYYHWNRDFDYSSYEHHEPTYDVYLAAQQLILDQPVLSEDRFRIKGFDGPGKHYTEEQTRRGLWASLMAGGVGNIWGNHTNPDGSTVVGPRSLPYPNPHWIKTYSRFVENRFSIDSEPASGITSTGWALRDDVWDSYIIYVEETVAFNVDLSGLNGTQPITLVDTTAPFDPLPWGSISPSCFTMTMPYQSDWAIYVGEVTRSVVASADPVPTVIGPVPFTAVLSPNPFTTRTAFAADLPVGGRAEISVVDVSGRVMLSERLGQVPAGSFRYVWDGRSRSGSRAQPGVYFVRLALPELGIHATRRVVRVN